MAEISFVSERQYAAQSFFVLEIPLSGEPTAGFMLEMAHVILLRLTEPILTTAP